MCELCVCFGAVEAGQPQQMRRCDIYLERNERNCCSREMLQHLVTVLVNPSVVLQLCNCLLPEVPGEARLGGELGARR